MDASKEPRQCLICSTTITKCRLGIDSCRACAVFYRRIRSSTRTTPRDCKVGDEKCADKGTITSCRKCRYVRITEILKTAELPEPVQTEFVSIESRRLEEHKRLTFIDHTTSYLKDVTALLDCSCLLNQPSCSTTPLLDKIRWSYSLMCRTLKSGELGTKSTSLRLAIGDYEGSKIRFVPVTYSMALSNTRIFVAALYDFANMAFPDFARLDKDNRELCNAACFELVNLVETTYRAEHHFPDDQNTHFTSYTTIINNELIQSFLDDCPFVKNKQDAIDALKVNMNRAKSMSRESFHRVKPDNTEFTALLGLGFWNNGVAYMNEELSSAVEKNRVEILKELQGVYKIRGMTDFATRLGELFCLMDSMEESVTLSRQDIEIYRLHNLFNEAMCSE